LRRNCLFRGLVTTLVGHDDTAPDVVGIAGSTVDGQLRVVNDGNAAANVDVDNGTVWHDDDDTAVVHKRFAGGFRLLATACGGFATYIQNLTNNKSHYFFNIIY